MTITTNQLASAYTNGVDATKELERRGIGRLWRGLIETQYNALTAQMGVTVTFAPGQAWAGAKAVGQDSATFLFDYVARTKTLPISTDFNDSELNGSRGNLLFRAAHDLSHILCDGEHSDEGVRCNFALDGETRAFARQARHLLELLPKMEYLDGENWTRIVQIAFSEVVLQAAVFYKTKAFAEQKVVLVSMALINAWLTQNGEPILSR